VKKNKVLLILLAVVLSISLAGVGCAGDGEEIPPEYDLTINSTACGLVTTPGEGTFTYNASTVVNLVATPDAGCRFVNWTGNVGSIANVTAATTTITMDDNYTITANFALGTLIAGVPDTNQPPTQNLTSTVSIDNYCAPMAMVNILEYWDVVMGHDNAAGVIAGLQANATAEYIGYFMDTNNNGSLARANGNGLPAASGTYAIDIDIGAWEFVRWDAGNLFATPLPAIPAGKIGYNWTMTPDFVNGLGSPTGFPFYKAEIDKDLPLVVCFSYWNPVAPHIAVTDPETGETIDVFSWGNWTSNSSYPREEWNHGEGPECIGHAVTGVGYILNWDPDGNGTDFAPADYVIVHDNWDTTPRNVAIPWDNWNSSHAVDPAGVPPVKYDLTIGSDMFGSVTTPGEGTFTCDINAVVNLVATPGADCAFVNWTGDVGTIADVNAANTTIIMDGDYSITANFLFTPVVPYP